MMDSVMRIERPLGPGTSAAAGGPAWFWTRRAEGAAAWRDLAWPTAKDARWRNSPLESFRKGLEGRVAEAGGEASPARSRALPLLGPETIHLCFVDGRPAGGLFPGDYPPGLRVGLGPEALPPRPPLSLDGTDLEDKLQARLWAESSDQVTISLAGDLVLDKPILVEWIETGSVACRSPLVFLNLGPGARARLDLLWSSPGARSAGGAYLSPALRIDLGPGARLGLFELVDLDEASLFLDYPRAYLGAGAELEWTRGFIGAGTATSRLRVDLAGRASRLGLSTFYAVGQGQHLETAVVQHHQGEATWSRSRFEGVVDGDGRAVCRGLIKVDKTAIGTDAYLSSRALALSPEAKTVSLPELAIDTNELTASHGSTVGSVGPEDLFYLGTRGLSPAQAKALVAAGILGGLLEKTPPELTAWVERRIDEALGHG